MSTHKHFDKICCVVLCLTLVLTILFMNAKHFGIQKVSTVMGYENMLFDTSKVHTIDIIMDNWENFTENCQSEEYYNCTVVIDNDAYKNVAIRGKGNTSLTEVKSYGNDRYSFKIEFDHYDSTNTYYGLDKLCLNNIIQDNTYMKDYLCYTMMNDMGIASPLCSYVYITVNGKDWGLYLAVEGVEESFLQRNYGKDYGELYKPDSMSMGGGRGNDKGFDISNFINDSESETTDSNNSTNNTQKNNNKTLPQMSDDNTNNQIFEDKPANFGDTGMTSSEDVLLKYIDDDINSYSNIFNNAKTNISDSDKTRLIKALKKLSNGEGIEDAIDVKAVARYFVVHNFVLNFDSYTGSMIHNYYLYENDGQMQMIPWDYNLAFGGFESEGSATKLVNYPIDSPVSGGKIEDRPMIAWLFASEEYTEMYHQYFAKFISEYFDSGYFEEIIDSVTLMISPYVEKDSTKFCTYEEFETGISTLKEFCLLRAKSIRGQLDGTIGSTSVTQKSDMLIDASNIQISDMGSMNQSMESSGKDKLHGDMHGEIPPDFANDEKGNTEQGGFNGQMKRPDGNIQSDNSGQMQPQTQNTISITFWNMIGISVLVLTLGLAFTFTYKRRK